MKNNLLNAFLEEINTKGDENGNTLSQISLNIPGGSKSLLDFDDQSNVYHYLKDSSPVRTCI